MSFVMKRIFIANPLVTSHKTDLIENNVETREIIKNEALFEQSHVIAIGLSLFLTEI